MVEECGESMFFELMIPVVAVIPTGEGRGFNKIWGETRGIFLVSFHKTFEKFSRAG